eukprot:TRINITY_DN27526_c0_g1_i3.p1 TRINITY_DN27526_c0_g1~~TRINITY_DN27526_c0_g1_i3.p1  ORF type:complete len:269 (-),score=57.29 TRINITY_DN27526_c0_g1_i3:132-938(-)
MNMQKRKSNNKRFWDKLLSERVNKEKEGQPVVKRRSKGAVKYNDQENSSEDSPVKLNKRMRQENDDFEPSESEESVEEDLKLELQPLKKAQTKKRKIVSQEVAPSTNQFYGSMTQKWMLENPRNHQLQTNQISQFQLMGVIKQSQLPPQQLRPTQHPYHSYPENPKSQPLRWHPTLGSYAMNQPILVSNLVSTSLGKEPSTPAKMHPTQGSLLTPSLISAPQPTSVPSPQPTPEPISEPTLVPTPEVPLGNGQDSSMSLTNFLEMYVL